jgi:hypothetical protein
MEVADAAERQLLVQIASLPLMRRYRYARAWPSI